MLCIVNSTGSSCGVHVYSPAVPLLSWKANSSGGGHWLAGDYCTACILSPCDAVGNTHCTCMCLHDVHPGPHIHVCTFIHVHVCFVVHVHVQVYLPNLPLEHKVYMNKSLLRKAGPHNTTGRATQHNPPKTLTFLKK